MNITYDGKDYSFDLDEISVSEATVIKRKTGLSLLGIEKGLREADVDALRAIYWLMLKQNGQNVNIDNVDFKVIRYTQALQAANEDSAEGEDPKAEAA
jgi:hypothetical protein